MFVYVLDYWEKEGGVYKGTRPWNIWYSDVVPCEWRPDFQHGVRPLRGQFCTPAVVIVHWTYLLSICGLEARQRLHELTTLTADLHIIVVSGAPLPNSGRDKQLYFRAPEVDDKIDDPFRDYFCEFLTALDRDPTPDFGLLEPEPMPIALMDAKMAMALDGEFPATLSAEARRQCLRIIARGDGRTAMHGTEVEWLKQADWPQSFLVDENARHRFITGIDAVLAALGARQGAGIGF